MCLLVYVDAILPYDQLRQTSPQNWNLFFIPENEMHKKNSCKTLFL